MGERLWQSVVWGGIIASLLWALWVTRTRPAEWTGWGLRRDTYRAVVGVAAAVCAVLALVLVR